MSVATLAWTVYKDLRARSSKPVREVVARRVRVKLESVDESTPADRDRIVEVVVEEIITAAEANPNELEFPAPR